METKQNNKLKNFRGSIGKAYDSYLGDEQS